MTDPAERDETQLRGWLVERVAEIAGISPAEIDADRPVEEYGLSSRDAVALSGELEELLDAELPATLLWETPTIAQLARRLLGVAVERPTEHPVRAPGRGAPRPDRDEAVAIVGLGCRLPGQVDGPEAFWKLLTDGVDAIGEVPDGRWEAFTDGSPEAEALLAGTNRFGGFLDDVAGFDAEFFGITPREATAMDPQQRLLLEVAWEALEHAGIPPESLRGTATGVFVGVCSQEYAHLTTGGLVGIDAYASTGGATSITANRLSYVLDLRGPSLAVDTACSSSLVAVHQACQSLRAGESATALVGGVNLLLSPAPTVNFDQAGALAADGRCKSFDAAADGMTRAEGCGIVVLKRLADAQRDGDRVLATIRASGVNSDGRSNGLTAPNPESQQELLASVYAGAGVDPTTVDYDEAHGTGTLLGDPIEAGALGAVLGARRGAEEPVLLGSVKTNLGHLEAAAGIAGLIKVVLSMVHGRIPPSLHFSEPNPHIPFEQSRLRVVTEATPWPRYSGRARAGVSGFGFGGTNAHVLLEEPEPVAVTEPAEASGDVGVPDEHELSPPAQVLTLSGASPGRLRDTAGRLAEWFDSRGERGGDEATDIGFTLARHRGQGRARGAVVGRSREDLQGGLRALADGRTPPGVVAGRKSRLGPGVVWVFSGYGSQWAGMARALLDDEPAFAAAVDELDPMFQVEADFSLREFLERGERPHGVEQVQLTVFGIQVCLAALWRSYGIEPAAVIGNSMGEVAAAVVAGALSMPDALRVMTVRARLLGNGDKIDSSSAMAALAMSSAEFEQHAPGFPGVGIAVHAAPDFITVAGAKDQVERLVEHLDGLGRTARLLGVSAGHSAAVDPLLDELAVKLAGVRGRAPQLPLYSTVLEDPRERPSFDAGYWVANTRRPVRFVQAVAAAAADGFTSFLEISPHPVASPAVASTLAKAGIDDPVLATTLHRNADDTVTFRTNLAMLHANGAPVRLDRLYPTGRLVDLPRTHWQHVVYWTANRPTPPGLAQVGHPLLGTHLELPAAPGGGPSHAWQADVVPGTLSRLGAQRVHGTPVLPAAGYAEIALTVAGEVFGAGPGELSVSDLRVHEWFSPEERTPLTTTFTATGRRGGAIAVHTRTVDGRWVRLAEASVTVGPLPRAAAEPGSATPISLQASAAHFRLHPALLDACLHALTIDAPVTEAEPAAVDGAAEGTGGACLQPVSIGALRLYGTGTHGSCIATITSVGADGPRGRVRLVDSSGSVVLEAQDVELRLVSADEVPPPPLEAGNVTQVVGAGVDTWPGAAALYECDPATARRMIADRLRTVVANVMGFRPDQLDEHTPLVELGLDSLMAVRIKNIIEHDLETPPLVLGMLRGAGLADLDRHVAGLLGLDGVTAAPRRPDPAPATPLLGRMDASERSAGDPDYPLRVLRGHGRSIPLFLFHAAGGSSAVYQPLVDLLGDEQPCYGLDRVEGDSLEARVEQYLPLIRRVQPHGPYRLAGWSCGGALAYETAQRLRSDGAEVEVLALIDTVQPLPEEKEPVEAAIGRFTRIADFMEQTYGKRVELPYERLAVATEEDQVDIVVEQLDRAGLGLSPGVLHHQRTSWIDSRVAERYQPVPYPERVVLYRAESMHEGALTLEPRYGRTDAAAGWDEYCDALQIVPVPGDHLSVIDPPSVLVIAEHLGDLLARRVATP